MTHTITLVPGDGIGPEVTDAVVRILERTGVSIAWEPSIGINYTAIYALDSSGPVLAAGGSFQSVAGAPRSGVAIFALEPSPIYMPLARR